MTITSTKSSIFNLTDWLQKQQGSVNLVPPRMQGEGTVRNYRLVPYSVMVNRMGKAPYFSTRWKKVTSNAGVSMDFHIIPVENYKGDFATLYDIWKKYVSSFSDVGEREIDGLLVPLIALQEIIYKQFDGILLTQENRVIGLVSLNINEKDEANVSILSASPYDINNGNEEYIETALHEGVDQYVKYKGYVLSSDSDNISKSLDKLDQFLVKRRGVKGSGSGKRAYKGVTDKKIQEAHKNGLVPQSGIDRYPEVWVKPATFIDLKGYHYIPFPGSLSEQLDGQMSEQERLERLMDGYRGSQYTTDDIKPDSLMGLIDDKSSKSNEAAEENVAKHQKAADDEATQKATDEAGKQQQGGDVTPKSRTEEAEAKVQVDSKNKPPAKQQSAGIAIKESKKAERALESAINALEKIKSNPSKTVAKAAKTAAARAAESAAKAEEAANTTGTVEDIEASNAAKGFADKAAEIADKAEGIVKAKDAEMRAKRNEASQISQDRRDFKAAQDAAKAAAREATRAAAEEAAKAAAEEAARAAAKRKKQTASELKRVQN